MKTITIEASASKGGKLLTKTMVDFPQTLAEAVEQYGEKKVFGHFVRNLVIEVQGKMRAEYKAPDGGGSSGTKTGSALHQILSAD